MIDELTNEFQTAVQDVIARGGDTYDVLNVVRDFCARRLVGFVVTDHETVDLFYAPNAVAIGHVDLTEYPHKIPMMIST